MPAKGKDNRLKNKDHKDLVTNKDCLSSLFVALLSLAKGKP